MKEAGRVGTVGEAMAIMQEASFGHHKLRTVGTGEKTNYCRGRGRGYSILHWIPKEMAHVLPQ